MTASLLIKDDITGDLGAMAAVTVPSAGSATATMAAPASLRKRTDEELSRLGGVGIEELFRRHNDALSRFCLGITGRADEAADATQTVWERALLTFSKRRGAVLKVRPWLYTVARNECLDRMRGRGVGPTIDVSDIELPGGLTPQETLEQRVELETLLSDLAGLSERQRSALVLREFAGFEAEELAAELGTSPSRALGLVAEARRGLVERRSGRGLPCSTAQRELSRMRRRSRGVQAHLDSCVDCRYLERRRRGRALSSLAITPFIFMRGLPERLSAIALVPPDLAKAAVATAIVAGSVGLGAAPLVDDKARPAEAAPRVSAVQPPAVGDTRSAAASRVIAKATTTARRRSSSRTAAPRGGRSDAAVPALRRKPTAAAPAHPTDAPAAPPAAASPAQPSGPVSLPKLPAEVDASVQQLDENVRATVEETVATVERVTTAAKSTLDTTAAGLSATLARTR